ncbi:MAG TPA: hypothetical protein VLS93_09380 [Anaeromyxobacteraceae bacterium]|nr:hypothetical protein [Anaeromyxobacteraceae bacterium]
MKAFRALAVLVGVVVVYIVLGLVAYRHALSHLLLVALVVLPVWSWQGRAFRRRCAAFAVAACLIAASPLDIVFASERGRGIRVAEASYGWACSSEACYGCTPPVHRARWAVVVALW